MHFTFAFAVISVLLTVACNGQFKIIGLLDTKSDKNNGTFEKIRSFDIVPEQLPQNDNNQEESGSTETISFPEIVDVNKENVNFIKPYDVTTNDLKKDYVEATSHRALLVNNTIKVSVLEENTRNENLNGKDISNTDVLADFNDVEITTASNPLTTSTTSMLKSYRKSFRPNIRKFAYVEARNFHHPDSSNNVTPSNRWNNHKFIKVLKYRNKYKSKCRCERIWNCPKIQISIQRCEPDYFMCCF